MERTEQHPRSTPGGMIGRFAVALVIAGTAAVALAPSAIAADTTSSPTSVTVISTAKDAKHGTFLAAGNTVYALTPSKTACDAKCVKARPPVVLPQGMTSATAGDGVDASKLGTTTTASGSLQITYDGKPLYFFSKDKAPGQVKGNVSDKWGKWTTVVTKAGTGAGAGSDSGGNKNAGSGGVSF